MTETFRIHLHDGAAQHTLSMPDDAAVIRVSVIPDDPNANNGSVVFEVSNNNALWNTLYTFEADAVNVEVAQPFLYLRAGGSGDGNHGQHATVVVEYLDDFTNDGSPTEVEITGQPVSVSGDLTTTQAPAQVDFTDSLLKEILEELRKQTVLLEEMLG